MTEKPIVKIARQSFPGVSTAGKKNTLSTKQHTGTNQSRRMIGARRARWQQG
jgi:hypothetical protein